MNEDLIRKLDELERSLYVFRHLSSLVELDAMTAAPQDSAVKMMGSDRSAALPMQSKKDGNYYRIKYLMNLILVHYRVVKQWEPL